MNHNPRKFEEKIALNKQKQAEADKQFADIIRDVTNIRDNEFNINQFRSLPNIHGPPPGTYQYGVLPQQRQDHNSSSEINHGLNLQLPENQTRRVLSDSQLHKTGLRFNQLAHPNTQLQRPKSASELVSYENSVSNRTGSLPDLSQGFGGPSSMQEYDQSILQAHYHESHLEALRMQQQAPYMQQGGYYMSIDEATGCELKHRQMQYSPSPPATPHAYGQFGSPGSYQRMTSQMQDVNLHSPTHLSHSGQASPEIFDMKPNMEESQYMYYTRPQPQHQHLPPSIPKIQVYTPDEAMSPQYYPQDHQAGPSGGSGQDIIDFLDGPIMHDEDEDVQGDSMYYSYSPYN